MNQYHIYEAIGRGKHSTVYKGRKKKTIEYFAIKSVDKTQKSRVLQEVRTLHSLDHSNVLKFYAWYETSAHLWLVLEYCVGGDLLTLLRQDTRLPEESIHDFARDLVHALQFLHSKGVIYCDLKPSNVLLDENGRLKLCDFGLARRLSDISKSSMKQLPQAKRGTPCYMAPELFQEGGVHSFASDLWALGCVMYECYAGRPPFISNSFTQLVNSILSDPLPALQGNPSKEFQDMVTRLLTKDPAKRMQWSELCQHPFWRAKMKLLQLPPQPAFTRFLRVLQQTNNHGGADNVTSHGRPAVTQRSGLQEQHSSRVEKPSRKVEAQPGPRKPLMTPSHGSPAVSPAVTHRGGIQEQHSSRVQKPSRKVEVKQGHRKPLITPSHGSPALSQKSKMQGQHISRVEKPSRKMEAQPVRRKPLMTPSKGTEPCENTPRSRGLNAMKATVVENPVPLKEDANQKNCGVNILRLSKIVKTNLLRETEGGNNRQQMPNADANDADLMIENHDLELDFAERMEGDANDEEDAADSSTSSDVSSESEKAVACNDEKDSNL